MRLFLRLFRLQLLIPSWDYDSFHLTITSCWLRRDTIGQCLLFSLNTVIRRIPGRFQLKLFWTPSPSVGGQFITRKSIHLQTQFSCHLHMFANRETQGEEEKRIQSRRREFTWRWKFSRFSSFRERNRHFLPLPIIIPSYCLLIHSSQFNCHEERQFNDDFKQGTCVGGHLSLRFPLVTSVRFSCGWLTLMVISIHFHINSNNNFNSPLTSANIRMEIVNSTFFWFPLIMFPQWKPI